MMKQRRFNINIHVNLLPAPPRNPYPHTSLPHIPASIIGVAERHLLLKQSLTSRRETCCQLP